MRITRALAALTFTAALALTGCSGGGSGADTLDGGQATSASDGGGSSLESDGGQDAASEADVDDVPEVVAEVNGEEISRDTFVESYEMQYQQAAMQQQTTGQEVDQDELKAQVADLLVDNELLKQAADDAGIEVSDEDVDAFLEETAQQNGLGSGDELISAMEQQGQDEEQIRSDAADQVQLDAYLEKEADITEPTDEELKEQYDQLVAQQESQSTGGDDSAQQEIPEFEEVKDQLAEQYTQQQKSEASQSIADDLREKGDVEIYL
jgi:peptidyl-prolyl cis-trans isomerase SurA